MTVRWRKAIVAFTTGTSAWLLSVSFALAQGQMESSESSAGSALTKSGMPKATATDFFSGTYILQVFLSLAVVLALLFAVLWLLKRFNGVGRSFGRHLQVVATVGLGQRERAVLLNAGDKQLLIGVAPGSVKTLYVFDEPVVPVVQATSATKEGVSFKEALNQALGKNQAPKRDGES